MSFSRSLEKSGFLLAIGKPPIFFIFEDLPLFYFCFNKCRVNSGKLVSKKEKFPQKLFSENFSIKLVK